MIHYFLTKPIFSLLLEGLIRLCFERGKRRVWILNPLLPSVPRKQHVAKISILK